MGEYKITYTRGSGPGGQHKNKVETCVTVLHVPTGLTERCQDTRSRARNEILAMDRLIKKIALQKQSDAEVARNELRLERIRTQKRVRTYNYITKVVTDHRTGKRFSLKKFMEGIRN